MKYVFVRNHHFRFQESEVKQGHTTFVQEEVFEGMFAFIMGTRLGFEGLNGDLKRCVEVGGGGG